MTLARRSQAPPDYLSRAVQRRLLAMVGLFILVLVLMRQSRRPDQWTWLWQLTNTSTTPPVTLDLTLPGAAVQSEDVSAEIPAILDPDVLASIQDDSHFRSAEQIAWFSILDWLCQTSEARLSDLSLGTVSYLQIYRQTAAYRGHVVDLKGTVRRAHRVSAPPNDLGIGAYIQAWLFLDQGPREPIVVYALAAPAGLRLGLSVSQPVRLTGVVYKRWSYPSSEGLKVAPVVLAKRLTLTSPPDSGSSVTDRRPGWHALTATLLTAVFALAFAVSLFRYTSYRFSPRSRRQDLPRTIVAPDAADSKTSDNVPGSAVAKAEEVDREDAPQ